MCVCVLCVNEDEDRVEMMKTRGGGVVVGLGHYQGRIDGRLLVGLFFRRLLSFCVCP